MNNVWLTHESQSSCQYLQMLNSTAWRSNWVEKQNIQTSLQTLDSSIQTLTEVMHLAAQNLRSDQYQKMSAQPHHV